MSTNHALNGDDPFDLQRFVTAQADTYSQALRELQRGRKRTHWMWFVFPQFEGLGSSPASRHYAIKSLGEARAYLADPVLGRRLRECAEALLRLTGLSASGIFSPPDDRKLHSSMTLFDVAAEPGSVFSRVLDAFFRGQRDERTVRLVASGPGPARSARG